MKTEKRYLDHKEMCELLDIPEESVLGFESFFYDPRAEMWVLKMYVGTEAEIEKLAETLDS